MNIEREISADGLATITFDVSREELGNKLPDALEQFRRRARIPGFRPGKAPLSVVKKRYGDDILVEKAEEIAREYMLETLKTEDLKPGGRITISLLKYGLDQELRFAVIFPLQPEVELRVCKGLYVSIDHAEVAEADVDAEIDAFRKDHAVLRSVDRPATAESKLELMVVEVDPSGLPLVNVKSTQMEFSFGTDQLGVGTDEQLLGICAGETRKIVSRNVGELIQSQQQSKIITLEDAIQPSGGTTRETLYSVEATRVEVQELPEADDDFAKKIDPNFNTLDDLRQMIKVRILGLIAFSYQKLLRKRLIDKLVKENPFIIHHSIIDNFLMGSIEKHKIKEDDVKTYFDKNRQEFEQEYRWILLRSKLIETENMSAGEDEIETEFAQISQQSETPIEEVRDYYQDKENRHSLVDTILERKVLRFLAESANIEKRSMSVFEFLKARRN